MGSGKDEVGNILGLSGWSRVALADPIKDAVLAVNPIVNISNSGDSVVQVRVSDLVDASGWDDAKRNTEVRRLLQRFGTDFVRNVIGPDIWVTIARAKIIHFMNVLKTNVVVTDVRFENEADMVTSMGGKVYWVMRPGTSISQHASESTITPGSSCISGVIDNSGNLGDLVGSVYRKILSPSAMAERPTSL